MKTIIEMAREAGFVMHMSELFAKEMPEHQDEFTAKLTAFAELVRADENEACAKVAEDMNRAVLAMLNVTSQPKALAAAIRARGNT